MTAKVQKRCSQVLPHGLQCSKYTEQHRPLGCGCEPYPRLCAEHRREHEQMHRKLAAWKAAVL